MKFSSLSAVLAALALLSFSSSCKKEEEPDYREKDYGYVQFKVYKEASYTSTKADGALDYLSDAGKVRVTLSYNDNKNTLHQTLTLTAADSDAAEYGLRSEKLQLVAGTYKVIGVELFGQTDEKLSCGVGAVEEEFEVVAGGLALVDLTADVTARGKVRFRFIKDYSSFENIPSTSATESSSSISTMAVENGEYTFDEIAYVDVTVKRSDIAGTETFEMLPVTFSTHFDEDDYESSAFGYQTSSLQCDSLVSIKEGSYTVVAYNTYNSSKVLKETNTSPSVSEFSISDNVTTDADVLIALHESDEYIKDYYALYEIWKALDGENWYYAGEYYNTGCNWDFNKSPDLWGDQPGVYIHDNGRIAFIDISDFGFRGDMPAALGQLVELEDLYLGTHNDLNLLEYDPSLDKASTAAERLANHKKYLHLIHPATQMSEPIARGLAENGITIRATELYDTYTENELIDKTTGRQNTIQKKDMVHGKVCNGLTSLPEELCNLVNLETLSIANGLITELPQNMGNLTALTDFELYNCAEMTEFPTQIADMPALVTVNISNNSQWSTEEIEKGMSALAKGKCAPKVQILYARENNITKVTGDYANFTTLGYLDLSDNLIAEVAPLGSDCMLVEFYLDNNQVTSLPENLCSYNYLETLSAQYNKMTKFPNIFSAKSNFDIESVDFSYNEIDGFEGEDDGTFKGINVGTLTLVGNKLTTYPSCIAAAGSRITYINMRACGIETIEDGAFAGDNSFYLISLDLSYNKISSLPDDFTAVSVPYLYGVDLSYNCFASFPWEPLDSSYLTVLAVRGQRDANGGRCLREWPTGIYNHKGMRGLYIGSNDLQKVTDTISYLIYYLDISDNPNIVFDASGICYYIRAGAYYLIYDKTQNITGCDYLF